ncbi:MAG TPA: arginine--tRNA ligase [Verrucomicrobiae bacterium]|nr:arginine--tRNA ligase [Verrucomicrobiae bacterium]
MYQGIEKRVREALAAFIRERYGENVSVATSRPPKIEMGEIASPVCFELAKRLKRAPRQLAQEIAAGIGKIEGVERVEVAGGGYLNAFLERGAFFRTACEGAGRESAKRTPDAPKAIVEHTAINPNKAAHIGHLRNAVIGDTFVRLLRACGRRVEVQNYIDNTGVQVADVVLGFMEREKLSIEQVRALAKKTNPRFDYYCWDLYAWVTQFLAEDKSRLELRGKVMKEIEEGRGAVAEMADFISTEILRTHLHTMDRLGIDYDLLSRESEVLGMKFWDAAFRMLKERGAIRLASSGKQSGCWIMPLGEADPGAESAEEGIADAKIIVRSNGTVTYVGKDIAYHLWKFGLLERDFHYAKFHTHPDGHIAWATTMDGASGGDDDAPKFGNAQEVFNVIDSRQKYPQQVVREGLRALGFDEQANHLTHIAYDVVGLTPRCATELGYTLSAEDAKRPYVEMSGRKGQGVKADDLLDQMEKQALAEVESRHRDFSEAERASIAHSIAIGALRYFLLKYTRSTIIAFDFKDALSFEGETGPYAQYAVVRARSIWKKLAESNPGFEAAKAAMAKGVEVFQTTAPEQLLIAPEGDDFWELVLLAGSLGARVQAAVDAQEPAFVAKYAFELAQQFNMFYHKHHILSEQDPVKQNFLLRMTALVEQQLVAALTLLGIEAPEKM